MSITDPRTSQRYMPRFEVWMNVFLHYAFTNVVNSLSMMETLTLAERGSMMAEMRVPVNKLIGNVLLLEAHVISLWREKDDEFSKAREKFHRDIHKEQPITVMMEMASDFYHEIIE